jgi:hypothetical protein
VIVLDTTILSYAAGSEHPLSGGTAGVRSGRRRPTHGDDYRRRRAGVFAHAYARRRLADPYALRARRRAAQSSYPVGWDGYLYPWTFNINDFEPIAGRIHMPPPSHQTFAGPNFVICSFCPRKLDFDPMRSRSPTTTRISRARR